MNFFEEPVSYQKTALSDLQGAWLLLRDEVVKKIGFSNSDKLLFHIDEAMSWECVRDLNQMNWLILLIGNIAKQSQAPKMIIDCIEQVRYHFQEVLDSIKEGKI